MLQIYINVKDVSGVSFLQFSCCNFIYSLSGLFPTLLVIAENEPGIFLTQRQQANPYTTRSNSRHLSKT
jgi:hypothetical protein